MRRWGIFLALLIGLFNFSTAGAASLKELLNKLENDIGNGAPAQILHKEIDEIKKAKGKYPIYHIPELNYLTKREIEPIPQTSISLIKKFIFFVEPLKRATEVLIFFLLFYTFIFYSQHIDLEPDRKKYLTLFLILVLALVVLVNFWPGFYFLTGMGAVLALSIKKKKTATFLFFAGIFSIFTYGLTENFLNYLQSPKFLYTVKTTRDGYAPPYLISSAIENPLYRKVELITNELALGELQRVKELNSVKTNDPYLIGIIYNDVGYVNFLQGDYQKALKAFQTANKYLKSPVVLFNLYITYSSLLMLEQANQIRRELLKEEIDISKASPIPLLIHVRSEGFETLIPYILIASFGAGLVFALIFDRFFGFYTEQLSSGVLQIPGMMSFINSKMMFFVIIFITALILNYILGKAICNI